MTPRFASKNTSNILPGYVESFPNCIGTEPAFGVKSPDLDNISFRQLGHSASLTACDFVVRTTVPAGFDRNSRNPMSPFLAHINGVIAGCSEEMMLVSLAKRVIARVTDKDAFRDVAVPKGVEQTMNEPIAPTVFVLPVAGTVDVARPDKAFATGNTATDKVFLNVETALAVALNPIRPRSNFLAATTSTKTQGRGNIEVHSDSPIQNRFATPRAVSAAPGLCHASL